MTRQAILDTQELLVTEHPILFSAPMVRAILEGRKTQTRRVAKLTCAAHVKEPNGHRRWHPDDPESSLASPYGQLGDRLWVRETWQDWCPLWDGAWCGHGTKEGMQKDHEIYFRADDAISWKRREPKKWRPSIFMPRWASRITLEVTGVRVERLQAIRKPDIFAEGIAEGSDCGGERGVFIELWDSINAKRAPWTSNPLVWVVEFKRLQS